MSCGSSSKMVSEELPTEAEVGGTRPVNVSSIECSLWAGHLLGAFYILTQPLKKCSYYLLFFDNQIGPRL